VCGQLMEELSSGSCQNETASRQQQSKVEDILVKLIRLMANVSISADVGQQLASTDSLLELLMHVISMCQLACCLVNSAWPSFQGRINE